MFEMNTFAQGGSGEITNLNLPEPLDLEAERTYTDTEYLGKNFDENTFRDNISPFKDFDDNEDM